LANFNFKAEMICGTDRDRIAALRHLAMKRAHELVTEFWNPIVEVSLDLLDRRRLNHAEVVAAIRRSAVGAKALGIEEHRREPQRPAYRAVTFARGSVLETESGHLLAIRSDGRARHFRSLGEAYDWL
jgi:hypothetical protein